MLFFAITFHSGKRRIFRKNVTTSLLSYQTVGKFFTEFYFRKFDQEKQVRNFNYEALLKDGIYAFAYQQWLQGVYCDADSDRSSQ